MHLRLSLDDAASHSRTPQLEDRLLHGMTKYLGQPVRIAFEFKDPNAQTQMSIAGESIYDYKYLVMPLRI